MSIEIKMPALSPTMEEGTLAKWLVKEGDQVKSGDLMAEIETDKATMEFEAVDEGRIGRLLVAEGTEGVKVNAPIAEMVEEGAEGEAAQPVAATEVKAKPGSRSPLEGEPKSRSDFGGGYVARDTTTYPSPNVLRPFDPPSRGG